MTNAIFKFVSDAQGGDHFTVVSFSAQEGISTLYRYEIEIKAPVMEEIDLDEVLDAHARFVTELDGVEFPVHGVLSSFEETRFAQNYSYYRAVLVPRLWKLSNYRTNEIFYEAGIDGEADAGQSIDRIIDQLLTKAGLDGSEYDLAGLTGNLLKREYRCQYNESDFAFLSRLMENEGVFYYFEQGDLAETIVFINDMNYMDLPQPRLLFDVAAQSSRQDDCVYAWSCRKQRLPENVIVRDYNPDEPSLDVSDITDIDSMGQGTEYIYGKNVKSDTEATYLSQIRAEEHICRKTQFFGESSVTRLQSGHLFAIDGHPNDKYSGVEYLPIEVQHEGASLDMTLGGGRDDTQPQYRNSFVAIPAEVQYRPPRRTPKPRITGTLHAVIDGELDSEYAQLDEQGRYKVSLPFDFHNEEHPEGLASARVRMMQPYAGKNRGMQFPMAKGTEVLLSFVDGDPDRPIIAGAINTAAAPGPVTADNQTESVIQTGGSNKIRMEDAAGSERVILESPKANSWVRVGAPNDPVSLNGSATITLANGATYTEQNAYITVAGVQTEITPTSPISSTPAEGIYYIEYIHGTDKAIRTVVVGDADSDITGDGIRIQSSGNLYLESQSQYAEYTKGPPSSASMPRKASSAGVNQIGDLYDNFGSGYNPIGLLNYADHGPAAYNTDATTGKLTVAPSYAKSTSTQVAQAHVRVSSLDTFNTQEGNIYDFGGYWNYNLGNSYAEDHINQSASLNEMHSGTSGSADQDGVPWASTILPIFGGVFAGIFAGVGIAAAVPTKGAKIAAVPVSIAVGAIVGWATSAISSAFGEFGSDSEARPFGDVIAGPGSGKITGPGPTSGRGGRVMSSFENIDPTTGAPLKNSGGNFVNAAGTLTPLTQNVNTKSSEATGPMHTDTTWVEKKFGDSYEYSKGNTLSVSHGHTESHSKGDSFEFSYGGRSEETKYSGAGILTYSSWSDSAQGGECTYNPQTGQLTSMSYKDRKDLFVDLQLNLPTTPVFSATCNIASMSTSAEFNTGISTSLQINLGLSTSVTLGVGFATEVEAVAGWKLKINPDDGIEFSGPGTKANKDAEFKASVMSAIVEDAKMVVKNEKLHASVTGADISDAKLAFRSGQWIYV